MLKRLHMTRQLKLMCYALVAATIVMTIPHFAFAWPWDDWWQTIVDAMCNVTNDHFRDSYALATGTAGWSSFHFDSFAKALNGDGSVNVFTGITAIATNTVKPIALGILSFVALIQLVQIASRIDSNATLPVVKEVVIFVVTMAIYLWLINHAADLLEAIFNVFNSLAQKIGETKGLKDNITFNGNLFFTADGDGHYKNVDLGVLIHAYLIAQIWYFAALFLNLVSHVIILTRTFQLYVMVALSPLPLSTLGVPEIRQWGVGFFKNFISLILANAICVIVMLIFVNIGSSFVGGMPEDASEKLTWITSGFINFLVILMVTTLGVIKSGSWAQSILGQ